MVPANQLGRMELSGYGVGGTVHSPKTVNEMKQNEMKQNRPSVFQILLTNLVNKTKTELLFL